MNKYVCVCVCVYARAPLCGCACVQTGARWCVLASERASVFFVIFCVCACANTVRVCVRVYACVRVYFVLRCLLELPLYINLNMCGLRFYHTCVFKG